MKKSERTYKFLNILPSLFDVETNWGFASDEELMGKQTHCIKCLLHIPLPKELHSGSNNVVELHMFFLQG